jgi:ABC-type branched-subunit amino acid transport system ATPase component
MSTVYDVLTALDKIGSITDIELEREGGIDVRETLKNEGVHVKVDNLTYTFSDAGSPVIQNFNLEIMPGERVCVAGANGSGKTLLMKLLTGYFAGFQGSITVNGLPLENIDLVTLREITGENFTDQGVFKGTVVENITCGRKHIDINQVMEAARLVNLHDSITHMPQGYHTLIDPEGKILSGGILRKLVLARCLVGNPQLILMEDNLQAILPEERMVILQNILREFPKATILIISNNPAIHQLAGRVVTMQKV